jgi:hypothetical protein
MTPDQNFMGDDFRSLAHVQSPDPRHNAFLRKGIETYHAQLNGLILNPSVPADVRVGFDTARNLLLYSFYVYRFSTVARFQAYAVLENAIKLRARNEPSEKFRGLRQCIEYALKNKWFRDDGVRQYLRLAKIRDDSSYLFMDEDAPRPMVSQAPDVWIQRIKESFPGIRNGIAHGTPLLLGGDFTVLEMCCDLVNQLFPAAPAQKSA